MPVFLSDIEGERKQKLGVPRKSSASLRPCWGPVLKSFPVSLGSLASAQCFSEELELVLHLLAKSTPPPLYVCIIVLISGDRVLVCNAAWLDTCYTAKYPVQHPLPRRPALAVTLTSAKAPCLLRNPCSPAVMATCCIYSPCPVCLPALSDRRLALGVCVGGTKEQSLFAKDNEALSPP